MSVVIDPDAEDRYVNCRSSNPELEIISLRGRSQKTCFQCFRYEVAVGYIQNTHRGHIIRILDLAYTAQVVEELL